MRVRGDNAPSNAFTLEEQPKKPGYMLARFFENVEPFEKTENGLTTKGYVYDEYHLELKYTEGLVDDILSNYSSFMDKAKLGEEELLTQSRTEAQERISGKCSEAICAGITFGGKHYALSEHDQLSINAAWVQVNGGAASVPYAADGEALTDYTAVQITALGKAAYEWGVVNRTYYGLLYAWIQREADKGKLGGIQYGSKLPDDLMQALSKTLSGAGIDITKYTAALTATK